MTLPTAITLPMGKGDGSLQVKAVSPLRAAGLPLIITVGLPMVMLPIHKESLRSRKSALGCQRPSSIQVHLTAASGRSKMRR